MYTRLCIQTSRKHHECLAVADDLLVVQAVCGRVSLLLLVIPQWPVLIRWPLELDDLLLEVIERLLCKLIPRKCNLVCATLYHVFHDFLAVGLEELPLLLVCAEEGQEAGDCVALASVFAEPRPVTIPTDAPVGFPILKDVVSPTTARLAA